MIGAHTAFRQLFADMKGELRLDRHESEYWARGSIVACELCPLFLTWCRTQPGEYEAHHFAQMEWYISTLKMALLAKSTMLHMS